MEGERAWRHRPCIQATATVDAGEGGHAAQVTAGPRGGRSSGGPGHLRHSGSEGAMMDLGQGGLETQD